MQDNVEYINPFRKILVGSKTNSSSDNDGWFLLLQVELKIESLL
jgi:hypothetical protein